VAELGDGLVSVGNEHPPVLRSHLDTIRAAAAKLGRPLPPSFHTAALTTAVVLRPGERVDSERVIEQCGSQVAAALHFAYEIGKYTGNEGAIPPGFEDVWEDYCAYVEKMETPAAKRYLQIHNGHCTFLMPAERRFVTAKTIGASVMVGQSDELIERIRAAEQAGLKEIGILPPMAAARTVFKEFAEQVIRRY
jgi:alkanesulfonate monooxygenase SsuD/methylene tetrahydromethanopterin reductase-like flavin-dependent oxidoreductase (luciferase family)